MTDLLHNPSWSPGGTQILAAVITKANPARQLYLLDVAGNEPAKLLPGLEPDRWYNDMAWSPDGTRIVVPTEVRACRSDRRGARQSLCRAEELQNRCRCEDERGRRLRNVRTAEEDPGGDSFPRYSRTGRTMRSCAMCRRHPSRMLVCVAGDRMTVM